MTDHVPFHLRDGEESVLDLPRPGEIGLTWISGWTGFWVSLGQWLAGDGGAWPWTRYKNRLERGYPTHVFLVLKGGYIFEAQPGGARIGHIEEYADREVLLSKLPLMDEQRARVTEIASRYEGVPYNWFDYLYLALYRFGIKPEGLKRRIQDNGRMICSQAVDKIEEEIGMNLFTDGRLNQDVTPGDIFRLVNEKGWM